MDNSVTASLFCFLVGVLALAAHLAASTSCPVLQPCDSLPLEPVSAGTVSPQLLDNPQLMLHQTGITVVWTSLSNERHVSGVLLQLQSFKDEPPVCAAIYARSVTSLVQYWYDYNCLPYQTLTLKVYSIISMELSDTLRIDDVNYVSRALFTYVQEHNKNATAAWTPRNIEVANDTCTATINVRVSLPPVEYGFNNVTVYITNSSITATSSNSKATRSHATVALDETRRPIFVSFKGISGGYYRIRVRANPQDSPVWPHCHCVEHHACDRCASVRTYPIFVAETTEACSHQAVIDTKLQQSQPVNTSVLAVLYVALGALTGVLLSASVTYLVINRKRRHPANEARQLRGGTTPNDGDEQAQFAAVRMTSHERLSLTGGDSFVDAPCPSAMSAATALLRGGNDADQPSSASDAARAAHRPHVNVASYHNPACGLDDSDDVPDLSSGDCDQIDGVQGQANAGHMTTTANREPTAAGRLQDTNATKHSGTRSRSRSDDVINETVAFMSEATTASCDLSFVPSKHVPLPAPGAYL